MTIFRRTSLLAVMVLWILGAAPLFGGVSVHAQEMCAARADAVEQLGKQYREKVEAQGLTQNGKAIFELFVSDSGSWTIVVSDPAGRSCIIAGGDYWQATPATVGNSV